MTYHKDHNISPALARRPIVMDTVHVNKRVHFSQISDVLNIPIDEIRALNPQFRKDMIPGDVKPYSLVLPSLQVYAYIANEDSILNHNAKDFARRGIVEPASGAVSGKDAKGEYYDEEVVTYHTVKKGETLTKIAKKYGITIATIKKYNKVGKSVKQGAKLKIVTIQRRYKPVAQPEPETTIEVTDSLSTGAGAAEMPVIEPSQILPTDSTSIQEPDSLANRAQVVTEFNANPAPAPEVETEPEPEPETKVIEPAPATAKPTSAQTATAKPKTVTHTVKRGENLSKIAKRYGTTVAAIKRANNMAGEQIQVGQKLKIPQK